MSDRREHTREYPGSERRGGKERRQSQVLCNHGRRESDQLYGFKTNTLESRASFVDPGMRAAMQAAGRGPRTRLFFYYRNHNGEQHDYLVEPRSLEFTPMKTNNPENDQPAWRLRCNVIERDGVPRPGERSFMVTGLLSPEELQPGSEFFDGHGKVAIG